jgi:UDP-GlcNAc:undecaprenyl-phosphate GlcNAc-1-phosphate transferase
MLTWSLLLTAVIAGCGSWFVVRGLLRAAVALELFDRRHDRGGAPAYRPIPRVGGLGIAAGALLAWLFVGVVAGDLVPAPLRASLTALLAVFTCGFVDDFVGVRASWKLIVVALAGCYCIAHGLRISTLPGLADPLDPAASALLTLFILIALPTAFNFIDGLDGLAAGLATIALLPLTALAAASGDRGVALVAAGLIGAVAGFWRENRHPARIFMGDGGSFFLGFAVAVLFVSVIGHGRSPAAAIPATVALAFPLVDLVLAFGRRLARRQLFSSDGSHLHHRIAARFGHAPAVRAVHLGAAALTVAATVEQGALVVALAAMAPIVAVGLRYRVRLRVPRPALVSALASALVLWSASTANTVERSQRVLATAGSPAAEHGMP